MRFLPHLITTVVLAVVLRWLWRAARSERATFQSGRQVFPPTKAIRFLLLIIMFAIMFLALAVASVLLRDKPGGWWVPYFFLGFVSLVLLSYPAVLTVETDGVGSRSWFGNEKKLRWEEISTLHYNAGNKVLHSACSRRSQDPWTAFSQWHSAYPQAVR